MGVWGTAFSEALLKLLPLQWQTMDAELWPGGKLVTCCSNSTGQTQRTKRKLHCRNACPEKEAQRSWLPRTLAHAGPMHGRTHCARTRNTGQHCQAGRPCQHSRQGEACYIRLPAEPCVLMLKLQSPEAQLTAKLPVWMLAGSTHTELSVAVLLELTELA